MAEKQEAKRSVDPAVQALMDKAREDGVKLAWDRSDEIGRRCPFGSEGLCCRICSQGPCRIAAPGKKGAERGVCGATADTIVARNFARMIAAGSSAHSDHGRDMALALLAVAEGKAPDYQIRDVKKLVQVARYLDVPVDGRFTNEVALDVAKAALAQFGQQTGEVVYIKRAPKKRQELWREMGLVPRGIDREVVDIMHRTNMGNDQDPEHILMGGLRCALADGWGGSMLSTDITDILFGTPVPLLAEVNIGSLSEDEVNIIVHGHEPLLSEMILAAVNEPDLIEYAKTKGAKGINLAGICCTSNETLMRQGIPSVGNFLTQELAIVTGAVEAMVVDIQCIMQALAPLAEEYHTKLITTSKKAMITGATHVEFDEHRAKEIAREIVKMAIDNYPNRGAVRIPQSKSRLVAGFSHEYLNYMQGGHYRGSFRPLNDAVMAGRIRGAAGVVGCNNVLSTHDQSHDYIVRELIKNDVLVVMTGCGAIACGKYGLLEPEAMEAVGPGLREVCEAIGIPPVIHMGSCVDNSRILTVLTQMASEGGLGQDISELPGVGIAPEWMSEKAISIGCYFVASGVYTIFGVTSPTSGSPEVDRILTEVWESKLGGKLELGLDPETIVRKSLEHIDKKREALGLPAYDPSRFGQSGDRQMEKLLEVEDRPVNVYSAAEMAK